MDTDQARLATNILTFGTTRHIYFEPEVATDGPFTVMLTLYDKDPVGVDLETALSAVDERASTAKFVIDRLIDWGYVELNGKGRYRLSISARRSVEAYLTSCLTAARNSV